MFCNDFEVNETKNDFEVNFQKVNSRSQQFLIVWFCGKNERIHAVRRIHISKIVSFIIDSVCLTNTNTLPPGN